MAADLDDTVFAANEALARTHRSSSAVRALGRVGAESEARAADLGRRAAFLGEVTAGQGNVESWSSAWDRRSKLAALWEQVDTSSGSDNDLRLDALLRSPGRRAWWHSSTVWPLKPHRSR